MDHLLQDLRVSLRALLRARTYSAIVVGTLALGVGVTGAVFSVVSGTLINPTPWRDPEALAVIADRNAAEGVEAGTLSLARIRDLRAQSEQLSGVAAAIPQSFVLGSADEKVTLRGVRASPEVFAVLKLELAAGRGLAPADAQPGAPCVAVLDHRTWVGQYGSDTTVVGRDIQLNGERCTVVGVLRSSVWFPNPGTSVIAVLPDTEVAPSRDQRGVMAIARIRDGVSRVAAQAELDVLSDRMASEHPASDAGWRLRAMEISELLFRGRSRNGMIVLAGAIGFLMLVACANLSGLLLSRAVARRQEFAVRAALGGPRARLVLQLLVENLLLTAAAVPLALLVARGTLELVYRQVPPNVLQIDRVFRFDFSVWLFIGGAALLTMVAFGLLPILRATRVDLVRDLKSGGDRGSSAAGSQWIRSGLVVAQVAGSVVLLVGASLLGRSFMNVVNVDTGIDMDGLVYAPIELPAGRYAAPTQSAAFVTSLQERLGSVGAVRVVGVTDSLVTATAGPTRKVKVPGKVGPAQGEGVQARWTAVSAGYLQALGLEPLEGRTFEPADDERGRRVALVSRSFATMWFSADESPLGRLIEDEDGTQLEVVGVVGDVKQLGIGITQRPQIYVAFGQQPSRFMAVVARARNENPLSIGSELRRSIEAIDAQIPLFDVTTAEQTRADAAWALKLFAAILALLGAVGLVMASIGIFGVVSYATQLRMRELGTRAALGASPASLMRLVLQRAVPLITLGLASGLVLAAVLSRALTTLLYEVNAFHPVGFLMPSLLLAAVALAAAAQPARRAARIDPLLALRAE